MHKQLIIMAALAASTLPVLQQAQAAQNLSSLMVEVRQQDGIPHYYNLPVACPSMVKYPSSGTIKLYPGGVLPGLAQWALAGISLQQCQID